MVVHDPFLDVTPKPSKPLIYTRPRKQLFPVHAKVSEAIEHERVVALESAI